MTRERCGLCGEPIDPGDADAVQVHGGEGGLVYEGCLAQYDDADDPPQDARPTGAQRGGEIARLFASTRRKPLVVAFDGD